MLWCVCNLPNRNVGSRILLFRIEQIHREMEGQGEVSTREEMVAKSVAAAEGLGCQALGTILLRPAIVFQVGSF